MSRFVGGIQPFHTCSISVGGRPGPSTVREGDSWSLLRNHATFSGARKLCCGGTPAPHGQLGENLRFVPSKS
jgi:hypothetical protein